jgi:N-acetylglutamate synthase-like GNAT family acetyltransferase
MSGHFLGESNSFSLRPAEPTDAKAMRMLLPPLGDIAAAFVAVDDVHRLVIGAAASAQAFRMQPVIGPGVAVHTIEPCRHRGIESRLLAQLEVAARNSGARAIYAATRVDQAGDDFRTWSQMGFQPCDTVEEHILPLGQIASRLVPLVERMRANGRIPANAQVLPLYKADVASVLQLHLEHMGGDQRVLTRKLRGLGPGAFLPRQSKVLLIDGKVKGCLLASRISKETIVVDANIVEPNLRGGWANAWLKLESFLGAPPGVIEFKFTSFDQYTDTRSFTEKLGGRTVRTTALMYRPIPAASADNGNSNG